MNQPCFQSSALFFREYFSARAGNSASSKTADSDLEYVLSYSLDTLTLWRQIRTQGKGNVEITENRFLWYLRCLMGKHFVEVRTERDLSEINIHLSWNKELTKLLAGEYGPASLGDAEADRRISKLIIDLESAQAWLQKREPRKGDTSS